MLDTNQKIIIKKEILDDRSEPVITFELIDGRTLEIKTSKLGCLTTLRSQFWTLSWLPPVHSIRYSLNWSTQTCKFFLLSMGKKFLSQNSCVNWKIYEIQGHLEQLLSIGVNKLIGFSPIFVPILAQPKFIRDQKYLIFFLLDSFWLF